jgi:aspartate racemase
MEHGFYRDRMAAYGLQIQVPDAAGRAAVHSVIFDELCRGIVRAESRARLMAIVAQGVAAGADSVILGCTEICLLLDPDALGCPGFDSTAIHARAAVDDALAAVAWDAPAMAA